MSSLVIFPLPKSIVRTDILNWQNIHISSLLCGMKIILIGRAKWEAPKYLAQSNVAFPGGTVKINGIIRDLEDVGVIILT